MPGSESALAVAAALLLAGVLASKVAARLGVPAVLLFLGLGMLAGSEGIGRIEFDDFELARTVGTIALVYILFAGGLDTRWREVRPVLGPGLALATVGVVVSAVVTGAFAVVLLDLSALEGLLLGSIVSSTDAAAVFSVLRSRQVNLRGRLRPLLELESGSNDPMAVFLTIGCLELLEDGGTSGAGLVPMFLVQMVAGLVFGLVLARVAVFAINRLRLEYEGLFPVLSVASVLLVYAVTTAVGGSGFLAVYVAGLTMGNTTFLHRQSLTRFHDALAWLGQIGMFLLLGLLVFPSDLVPLAGRALLLSLVLLVVARPIAVFASLLASGLATRERLLVAWVGLRGAVPVILATFPEAEGLDAADTMFNVVFFIVITSVLVQGTTVPVVARWLGVEAPAGAARPPQVIRGDELGERALHEVEVGPGSAVVGCQVLDLALPPDVLLVLIARGDEHVVPQGATTLAAGDRVLVLADDDRIATVRALLGGSAGGPGPGS